MRHPRPWLQHEAGNAAHRDMGANTGDIDHHEGAIQYVELAFLDIQDGQTFLDRDGFERRQQFSHQ